MNNKRIFSTLNQETAREAVERFRRTMATGSHVSLKEAIRKLQEKKTYVS